MTSDGKPYPPLRFKQIVSERYEISKRIHTSYNDSGSITPREREIILELIKDDIEHDNELVRKLNQQSDANSKYK